MPIQTITPKPPLSCDEISRRIHAMRMANLELNNLATQASQHIRGSQRTDERILDLLDGLNRHHFIVATAFIEISAHDPGTFSESTFKQLSQMLVRD